MVFVPSANGLCALSGTTSRIYYTAEEEEEDQGCRMNELTPPVPALTPETIRHSRLCAGADLPSALCIL